MAISVRLSKEDDARLDALAARTGRSRRELVHEAIAALLDELEESSWAEQAVRTWEVAGKPSRPAHQVWSELSAPLGEGQGPQH